MKKHSRFVYLPQIHFAPPPFMTVSHDLDKINQRYKTGIRTEYSYSGDLPIFEEQYFAGVPQITWEFYIGGYQPAQKWLKDRKGRTLTFDDILHYQKIIVALTETDRLIKEIEKI